MKPLAIELFSGTGSGTAGWCELGGLAKCYDLEYLPHHGESHPNATRYVRDVQTIHGSEFADADFIWGSSPCQAYSYLAMPWSRSKCPLCKGKQQYFAWQLNPDRPPASANVATWGDPIPCDCKENSAKAKELQRRWELDGPDNTLFDSVVRIQREASAAAGRLIPFIQENVRGAVPWVGNRDMSLAAWKSLNQDQRIKAGRADAIFGSFYLWGSCGQIGNRVIAGRDLADIAAGRGRFGMGVKPERAVKVPGQIHGKEYAMCRTGAAGQTTLGHPSLDDFTDSKGRTRYDRLGELIERHGNDIADALKERYGHGRDDARDVESGGLIGPDGFGDEHPGAQEDGGFLVGMGSGGRAVKTPGRSLSKGAKNKFGTHNMGSADKIFAELEGGTKIGGDWFSDPNSTCRKHGSRSNARKAASALIAKIPAALSDYVARVHFPV